MFVGDVEKFLSRPPTMVFRLRLTRFISSTTGRLGDKRGVLVVPFLPKAGRRALLSGRHVSRCSAAILLLVFYAVSQSLVAVLRDLTSPCSRA